MISLIHMSGDPRAGSCCWSWPIETGTVIAQSSLYPGTMTNVSLDLVFLWISGLVSFRVLLFCPISISWKITLFVGPSMNKKCWKFRDICGNTWAAWILSKPAKWFLKDERIQILASAENWMSPKLPDAQPQLRPNASILLKRTRKCEVLLTICVKQCVADGRS